MLFVHSGNQSIWDAAVKFAKDNGSFDKNSDYTGLEDKIEYLNKFACVISGTGTPVEVIDPTKVVVVATPGFGLGSHGWNLRWWSRDQRVGSFLPGTSEEDVRRIFERDQYCQNVEGWEVRYAPFMGGLEGGLVYHQPSNSWDVHT